MGRIMLCAPTEAFLHPGMLGLGDVNLDSVDWMILESDAKGARDAVFASEEICEAWVFGSDDMEALNIAAAMHADKPQIPIYVIVADVNGSTCSRARAAGVSGVLGIDGLARKFSDEKAKRERLAKAMESLEANLEASLAKHLPKVSGATSTLLAEGSQVPLGSVPKKHEGSAYVLTVLSGSGGAGKSTISAVSAYVAAAKGHRVLLLDCDLQFGDLAYLTGESSAPTADDVLADPEVLERLAMQVQEEGVALLAAPKRLEQAEVVGSHISGILDAAAGLFDLIIANTGASWAEYHAALIERSDCALFLIDQKASSVRACRHAVELCERLGIASGTFSYAINKCKRGALFTSIDVACAMQGVHVHELKDGGPDVEELLGVGDSDDLLASKNGLCASVSDMLDSMLPSGLSASNVSARSKRRAKSSKSPASSKRILRRRMRKDEGSAASGKYAAHAGSKVLA